MDQKKESEYSTLLRIKARLKALKQKVKHLKVKRTNMAKKTVEKVVCTACEGTGLKDQHTLCAECNGIGTK